MAGNLLRVKDLGEVEVTVLSSVIWRGAGKEIVLVLRSPAFAGWRGLHKDELETLRRKKEKEAYHSGQGFAGRPCGVLCLNRAFDWRAA